VVVVVLFYLPAVVVVVVVVVVVALVSWRSSPSASLGPFSASLLTTRSSLQKHRPSPPTLVLARRQPRPGVTYHAQRMDRPPGEEE
jgi:hypothetical protein